MNGGKCYSRCCLSIGTHIALEADDHAWLIGIVQTQSSTCDELAASSKLWIRPNCAHIRQCMSAFKKGCRQASSSNCDRRDSSGLRSCAGSTGNG